MTEQDFLLQLDWRGSKIEQLGTSSWITVYSIEDSEKQRITLFSGLIPTSQVDEVLSNSDPDIGIGDGLPGYISEYEDGIERTSYVHFSDTDRIQPIVLVRSFHGVHPSYIEILEEFRLFHNLYFEANSGNYLQIDGAGNDSVVIRTQPKRVEIRLGELKEFLAAKGMLLALYFGVVRYSEMTLPELGLSEQTLEEVDDLLRYQFVVDDMRFPDRRWKSISVLTGKKLVAGYPSSHKDDEERFEEFIIGTIDGQNVSYTCDPNALANPDIYWKPAPSSVSFLSEVFFRREVLQKYYNDPAKYTVHDGYISCGGLWSLHIDNNHSEYVVVYLGDLGSLAHSEQIYWKSYNVPPDGGASRVYVARTILAQFTEAERLDFLFKSRFKRFQKRWNEIMAWDIFLPLDADDEHRFQTLHIPLGNNPQEFENQVFALAKLLVDSLNDAKLIELAGPFTNGEGSLAKFKKYMTDQSVQDVDQEYLSLKKIQDLRSSGIAHRKGKKYHETIARYGWQSSDPDEIFQELLKGVIGVLDALEAKFLT